MYLTSKSSSGIFATTGSLSMGPGTHEIPLELFAVNRRRLAKRLSDKVDGKAMVLLQGGTEIPFYNSDTIYHFFRQEPYFMWTFGVLEPGCYGALDVASGSAFLFVPRTTDRYESIWAPKPSLEDYSSRYNIRNVHYFEHMATILHNAYPTVLLTLKGVNSDSGLATKEVTFPGIEEFTVNNDILFNLMSDLRVFKTDLEIELMKYITGVSSEAHRRLMRFVKGGDRREYQCEAEFTHHCHSVGGSRQLAYTPICGTNTSTAILHFGHAATLNDKEIYEDAFCLFDMGASYFGYCSSVACCYPANGKFTHEQKVVYEAVLAAGMAVIAACKPGVSFGAMHILAQQTLLQAFVNAKILEGDAEAMASVGLGAIFMPHGIGHFIGLDVHDVGGYLPSTPPRRGEPRGIEKLRTARILEKRMVLCITPGCYFIDALLKEALTDPVMSKYFVQDAIDRFRVVGGVRITDTVVITKDGAINITKIPRTTKDIEKWMAGRDDKKYRQSLATM